MSTFDRVSEESFAVSEDVDRNDVRQYDSDQEVPSPATQNRFLLKVYGIVMVALMISIAAIGVTALIPNANEIFFPHPAPMYAACSCFLVSFVFLFFHKGLRRTSPLNFIFFAVLIFSTVIILMFFASSFGFLQIMIALGTTAAICLIVTIVAIRTSVQYNVYFNIIIVLVAIAFIIGMLMFWVLHTITMCIFVAACVPLFIMFLLMHTQLMMQQPLRYSMRFDEVILSAVFLYLDAAGLFIVSTLVFIVL